jgi:hypothetical protein
MGMMGGEGKAGGGTDEMMQKRMGMMEKRMDMVQMMLEQQSKGQSAPMPADK